MDKHLIFDEILNNEGVIFGKSIELKGKVVIMN
jgi:hypothetical protein